LINRCDAAFAKPPNRKDLLRARADQAAELQRQQPPTVCPLHLQRDYDIGVNLQLARTRCIRRHQRSLFKEFALRARRKPRSTLDVARANPRQSAQVDAMSDALLDIQSAQKLLKWRSQASRSQPRN